ncbi:MAG: type II secretion system GspH family protein [Candidatus Margulisbacteria bacterium]|nr:type II secretion system GspH family protein [Candidatus Margulisiibacteriota bacterium]
MKNNSGFTLIELLIVITIIGILSTMLLPNLNAAQDKAKEASVKSIMHTLQLALESYAVDEGIYPAGNQLSVEDLFLILAEDNYLKRLPTNPFTKAPYQSSDSSGQIYYSYVDAENGYILEGYGRNPAKTILALSNY